MLRRRLGVGVTPVYQGAGPTTGSEPAAVTVRLGTVRPLGLTRTEPRAQGAPQGFRLAAAAAPAAAARDRPGGTGLGRGPGLGSDTESGGRRSHD